jgi:hypothetical protein
MPLRACHDSFGRPPGPGPLSRRLGVEQGSGHGFGPTALAGDLGDGGQVAQQMGPTDGVAWAVGQ